MRKYHTTIWICRPFVCPQTPPPFTDRSAPNLAGRSGTDSSASGHLVHAIDGLKGYISVSLCRRAHLRSFALLVSLGFIEKYTSKRTFDAQVLFKISIVAGNILIQTLLLYIDIMDCGDLVPTG